MVRIRGFGTINDNSPLYVIDGTPTKGNLNSLNLNDIESMQILKDASAASIYGSRAGNGVVIITTKQGKAGKPTLTYDAYYGTQSAWKGLDLANTQQYADLLWRSRINALNTLTNGVATPNAGQSGLLYPTNAQFGNGTTPGNSGLYYSRWSQRRRCAGRSGSLRIRSFQSQHPLSDYQSQQAGYRLVRRDVQPRPDSEPSVGRIGRKREWPLRHVAQPLRSERESCSIRTTSATPCGPIRNST